MKILSLIKVLFLRKLNRFLLPVSGGRSFALEKVVLVLTYRCNSNCPVCFLWGRSGAGKFFPEFIEDELSLSSIKNFIDDVAGYYPSIIITGGEPFLSENLFLLAEYIKTKNLRVNIITNGSLLEENIENILSLVDTLQVSIDGPNKEIHNSIRKSDFGKIIKGIKVLDEQKKLKRRKLPDLNIGFTISNLNYSYIKEAVSFLDALGVKIRKMVFLHTLFTGKSLITKHCEEIKKEPSSFWNGFLYEMPEFSIQELIEQTKEVKNKRYKNVEKISFTPDFTYDELKEYYANLSYIPERFSKLCIAPWLEIDLLPNGILWTCTDYIIGNIKRDKFSNLWNNYEFRNLRREVLKRGAFPICRVCASLYEY